MTLSREHHAELNGLDIEPERFEQLRKQYRNDSVALQKIDVYDPESLYNKKYNLYIAAIRCRDRALKGELERWFAEYYPDIN